DGHHRDEQQTAHDLDAAELLPFSGGRDVREGDADRKTEACRPFAHGGDGGKIPGGEEEQTLRATFAPVDVENDAEQAGPHEALHRRLKLPLWVVGSLRATNLVAGEPAVAFRSRPELVRMPAK